MASPEPLKNKSVIAALAAAVPLFRGAIAG
jgi:hypothetical protein